MMNTTILQKWDYIRDNYFTKENPYFNYGCRFLDASARTLVLLIVSVLLHIGLLYLGRIFWYSYISTPIGQQFIRLFQGRSEIMFDILNKNVVEFSFELVIMAFVICCIISALCQFLHITRYLYQPRGLLGKITLWGLPLAFAVATCIKSIYGFEQWRIAYAVALIPTLCVFMGSFGLTHALLPELGDFVRETVLIKERILSKLSESGNSLE